MAPDDRLAEVLGAWYEARDSGNPRDPADVIAEHPDLADELRVHFELMETIGATRPATTQAPTRLGCYEILSELGSGGMGTVYHGRVQQAVAGLEAGVGVALKVIHPNLLSQPGFFKRFLREAQIGQEVRHENVVRTYDCDATESGGKAAHYLVMEYVEGQTLRDLLVELERVPEELCRHIGLEVAKGLAAIHEAGVVHRDVKPENVLITEEHVVKVMDLGVARLQEEALRLSQAGAFVGSLEYAAPEQFRSAGEDADGRADLHALGVVLYELSTGLHPYRDEDAAKVLRNILDEEPRKPGEVNPQLSPFFEEVICTLMAKDKAERFGSAADLAAVLAGGEQIEWWKDRARALRLETKQPLRRIRIPRETALYGRDDDLAKLRGLFDEAKEGEGQVVLIEGEAGIGKTRLVDEFVGRLRQQGEDVNFLFGSYPPGGAATAAGAFSEAYREQFGADELEETLAEYVTPTPILIPAFAAILKGETTPTGAEPLAKDSLQTVFVHATRGLAAERTTIVLIDDLHFAPEDGRALFSSLAMAVPGHRILLVGTMRPGVPEDWIANVERLDHASRTVLSRLGPKDLSALLKDAFRSERLAHELGMKIAEKSDGNPFFAFEIIRGLREGQFISQQPDGTWVTTKVIEDIQVPSSVMDLVQARIRDLADEEKDLLDVASCCGFVFDPGLVAAVVGLPRLPALKQFGRIEKSHRLIRSTGRTYTFDHHQVQEALYAGLHEQMREEYHTAIAEAVETRAGATDKEPKDLDGSLCVDLCENFLRGGQGERALRYLGAALSHLESGYLNDQAVTLMDRALSTPCLVDGAERIAMLLRKCNRLDLLGRVEAQEALLEQARVAAGSLGEKRSLAEVMRAAGILFYRTGRYEEAQAQFEGHLQLCRSLGDKAGEAGAQTNLGLPALSQGRHEDAQVHFERGLAASRAIAHRQYEGSATGNLAVALHRMGQRQAAHDLYRRRLAIAAEIGDRQGEAVSMGNLGLLLQELGRWDEAHLWHERHRTLSREIGYRRGEAVAVGHLGLLAGCQGHLEASLTLLTEELGIGREIGDCDGEALSLCNLGAACAQLGDHARARTTLEESLEICREIGVRRTEHFVLLNLANLAEEEGDAQDALRLVQQSMTLSHAIGDVAGTARAALYRGCLLQRLGQPEASRQVIEEALVVLRERGALADVAFALASLSTHGGGSVADPELALERSGDSGNTTAVRLELWKATGKHEHLAEAKRLMDYSVEHAPPEYRESMLKNVRLHREIMDAWQEHGDG